MNSAENLFKSLKNKKKLKNQSQVLQELIEKDDKEEFISRNEISQFFTKTYEVSRFFTDLLLNGREKSAKNIIFRVSNLKDAEIRFYMFEQLVTAFKHNTIELIENKIISTKQKKTLKNILSDLVKVGTIINKDEKTKPKYIENILILKLFFSAKYLNQDMTSISNLFSSKRINYVAFNEIKNLILNGYDGHNNLMPKVIESCHKNKINFKKDLNLILAIFKQINNNTTNLIIPISLQSIKNGQINKLLDLLDKSKIELSKVKLCIKDEDLLKNTVIPKNIKSQKRLKENLNKLCNHLSLEKINSKNKYDTLNQLETLRDVVDNKISSKQNFISNDTFSSLSRLADKIHSARKISKSDTLLLKDLIKTTKDSIKKENPFYKFLSKKSHLVYKNNMGKNLEVFMAWVFVNSCFAKKELNRESWKKFQKNLQILFEKNSNEDKNFLKIDTIKSFLEKSIVFRKMNLTEKAFKVKMAEEIGKYAQLTIEQAIKENRHDYINKIKNINAMKTHINIYGQNQQLSKVICNWIPKQNLDLEEKNTQNELYQQGFG